MVLSQGLNGRRQTALATLHRGGCDPEATAFLESAIETIDAVVALASRYAEEAAKAGRPDLADILSHVPANPSTKFRCSMVVLTFPVCRRLDLRFSMR